MNVAGNAAASCRGRYPEIWDYFADDNPAADDRRVDPLNAQFRMLATQPKMGRARDKLAPGVRSFPIGRYVVFYVPLEDGIDVVRVLHGAPDIDAVFHPEQQETPFEDSLRKLHTSSALLMPSSLKRSQKVPDRHGSHGRRRQPVTPL